MIKVLIADDQELFSDLLGHMLKNCIDIEVVARAGNGNEAVRYAQEFEPDVILMDVSMPICNGIEATKKIRELGLSSRILILTASRDGEDVSEAINNGAHGYILKSINKERLILAIQSINAGMEIMDHDISAYARNPVSLTAKEGRNIVRVEGTDVELSDRELKIINMIVEGKSAAEMAQTLYIAEGRIRNIITEILSKLMLKDRTQLAVFAIKNKLVK